MNGKELSESLRTGKRVYGTCVTSTSPLWVAHVRSLAIDFIFIDTEHIPIDRNQLSWMCQAFKAIGVAPIVRIPSPDPYEACMAIDAGACGVLGPYIENAEQVRALRGAVKLNPLKGKKLKDVLEGTVQLSAEEDAFLLNRNEHHLLLINIESQTAIDAMDEMLGVPGVDGVIIGPHDLSINIGFPEQFNHPAFEEAVITVIDKARAFGVSVGNHFSWGVEQQIDWARRGMNIILNSSDIVAFVNHIGSELNTIRAALRDETVESRESIQI